MFTLPFTSSTKSDCPHNPFDLRYTICSGYTPGSNFCKGATLIPLISPLGLNIGMVIPSLSIEAKEHKSDSL